MYHTKAFNKFLDPTFHKFSYSHTSASIFPRSYILHVYIKCDMPYCIYSLLYAYKECAIA